VKVVFGLDKQEVEEEIKAIIANVPVLKGEEVLVRPLGGGLTNRNYRLRVAHASYVLRIAGEDSELLGIRREQEVACSRAAAGVGVGPEVIEYLPRQKALVTRFVTGRQLTDADVRQPDMLLRLAQTLRVCHECPVSPDLGDFSPFDVVRDYHELARNKGVALPEDLGRALAVLARMEVELDTDDPPCLCHNDLLPANFIDDGTTIRIIDWEYSGLGDRFFDLGNLAVNNGLDERQERALLRVYFGKARPRHLRRLQLMRLVSDMREAMWGFVQAGISKLYSPEYYLAYGSRHLQRFLKGCATLEAG
jgi:thiamine kinase-like enzyme